jgi:hypothetical protein
VTQPERLLLAHVGDGRDLRLAANGAEELDLAAVLEELLEGGMGVEVILDDARAGADDDDDLLDPGGDRLLDRVLDDRPVDERQDLLRDGFRRGQEPGPVAGGRQDRLADARCDRSVPPKVGSQRRGSVLPDGWTDALTRRPVYRWVGGRPFGTIGTIAVRWFGACGAP